MPNRPARGALPMNRMQKAYTNRFRLLLQPLRPMQLEQGVYWLVRKAEELMRSAGLNRAEAFARAESELAGRVALYVRRHPRRLPPASLAHVPDRYLCDVGLGRLARWLRAIGYDAAWQPHISDDALIDRARRETRFLITTDSMLMERRLLRDGEIPAFWVPPTLNTRQQFRMVVHHLGLEPRTPRCMKCGGQLRLVDKESVWNRIPPRTRVWLDTYYLCQWCDRLFWHGTHWRRMKQRLQEMLPSPSGEAEA